MKNMKLYNIDNDNDILIVYEPGEDSNEDETVYDVLIKSYHLYEDKEDKVITPIQSKLTVDTIEEAQFIFTNIDIEEATKIYKEHVISANNIAKMYYGCLNELE